jgi:hypothetical protein
MFFVFGLAMRTLSHEKTSAWKNLNESAGTRHKLSHKTFASQQFFHTAVFPQERFLGSKFPYGISLKSFQRKFWSQGRILAEKLAGRSIVAEQFVLNSQEEMFSKKRLVNFSDRIPGNKISGKDALHENSNSLLPRQLGFRSRYAIERYCIGKDEVTSCFSYDISLYACFLAARNFKFHPQKMLLCNFPSKGSFEQAFLQGIFFASKVLCK